MQNMQIKKFLKYLENMNQIESHFFNMAMAAIFLESLFPEQFNEEDQTVDLVAISKEMDKGIFDALRRCALEFFFSNEYQTDSNKAWNIIDIFLAKKHKTLDHKEIKHLQALRNSYMSIYEVVDIKIDKSITLRDIVDNKATPIIVSEKKATHRLSKWDLIGARIVKLFDTNLLAGGALILTREAADRAKADIGMITEIMMSPSYLPALKKIMVNPELTIKKMWAKEIIGQWFHATIEQARPKTFHNTDGHKIEFYTLEYPIKKQQREVIKILNGLGELHPVDIEGCKHAWIWEWQKNVKDSVGDNPNVLTLETHLDMDDNTSYSIFAELKLSNEKLEIDVNSKERANILQNYIQLYLGECVLDPIVIQHDLISKDSHDSKQTIPELSIEETQEIINTLLNKHYTEWLDSRLPALDNETPSQAVKNPVGRQKVINLIKDMSRKRKQKENNYNFNKLFAELGIEEAELK